MRIKILATLALCICGCAIFVPTERTSSRSNKVQLNRLPTKYPQDFHTGIVIAIQKEGPLIRDPMEIVLKNLKSGEILRAKASWGFRTGIALTPSDYEIRTWVPYMGKDIWETKKEAIIDSAVIAELTFDIPTLVTSQAAPHLSPYRANRESRQ